MEREMEGGGDTASKVLELTAVIEPDGKYFTALCLELNVSSFGDTPEGAFDSLRDAVNEYLLYALETGQHDLLSRPIPKPAMKKYAQIVRKAQRKSGVRYERRPFKVTLPRLSPLAAASLVHG